MMTSDRGRPSARGQETRPIFLNTHIVPFDLGRGQPRSGVRTIEPPADTRQSIRGYLYLVVDLYAVAYDPALDDPATRHQEYLEREQIVEQILGIVQRTYYTAPGAQSAVLKEAVQRVHRTLIEVNQRRSDAPLRCSIACAALLKDQLALISAGPVFSLVASDATVFHFPIQVTDAAQALGGDHEPDIYFYREAVTEDTVLFLGGGEWLDYIPLRTLLGTVAHTDVENSAAVIDYLRKETGDAPIPALIVLLTKLRSAASRSQAPASAQPSSGQGQSAGRLLRPPSAHGLPTSVGATPPVHTLPDATAGSTSPSAAETPADWTPPSDEHGDRRAAKPYPVAHDEYIPSGADRPQRIEQRERADGPGEYGASRGVTDIDIGEPTQPVQPAATASSDLTATVQRIMQRLQGWMRSVLPEPQLTAPASRGVDADQVDRVEDGVVGAQAEAIGAASTTLDHNAGYTPQQTPLARIDAVRRRLPESSPPAFRPPEPARGGRARLFILLAVLFLALVPIIVAATVWQQGATVKAEANALIDAAGARVMSARVSLDNDDKIGAREQLYEARGYLNEAKSLLPGDQRLSELELQVEKELQEVEQARLLYRLVEPLTTFPVDAVPHRVLVVGQDIYVLDTGRNVVQHFRLDAARQTVEDPNGDIIIRQGQMIDGLSIGPLVDLAWQRTSPVVDDKANLLVLDRNNNIFRYNGIEGVTHGVFGDQGAWSQPSQIETYLDRLYLADEGRRQIYRYELAAAENPPEPWFAPQTEVNLTGLLSMVIDGDIWMLFSNNLLLRYRQGEQIPFALESDVGLLGEPVDLFVGDSNTSAIYIADASAERILVFSKEGAYQYQLKAAEGNPLAGLRGIYVDEVAGVIYILTRNALFQHPLPQ